jgi:hypothetical protein
MGPLTEVVKVTSLKIISGKPLRLGILERDGGHQILPKVRFQNSLAIIGMQLVTYYMLGVGVYWESHPYPNYYSLVVPIIGALPERNPMRHLRQPILPSGLSIRLIVISPQFPQGAGSTSTPSRTEVRGMSGTGTNSSVKGHQSYIIPFQMMNVGIVEEHPW